MITNLFPSTIYYAPLLPGKDRRLLRSLQQECFKFVEIDDQGHEWSEKNYAGGYTSYGSVSQLHEISGTFTELKNAIDPHVRKYVQHLEMDVNPKQIQMKSCWINVMPAGVVHSAHIHPLSVISGTYYVQTPKNSSAIKFEDPRLVGFMGSPPRKSKARQENQRFVEMKPQAGHVILFESWMRHEVPQNTSESERISISFNYDWV